MPLLYRMACSLLTVPAASTSNERTHSTAGRIMSKLRCSLTSENLNRNMMAWKIMRKTADDAAKDLEAAPEDGCLDEAVDKLFGSVGGWTLV